ncbi:EndoS/ChiA family endoglycosidase [Bifidobacterium favimelis]
MSRMRRVGAALGTAAAMVVALAGTGASAAPAGNGEEGRLAGVVQAAPSAPRHFMVYYRAWRDKTMKGVNTDLPDDNWITMYDIPYGVDVVNVFSYVPRGQEDRAKPFYDTLKSSYGPYLHARGIKMVRGIGYSDLLKVPHAGETPTKEECDRYARTLVADKVTSLGLDGMDIDMEDYPTTAQAAVSDMVIKSLSKYLGPKASNGTVFIYDTNGSNLLPLRNVADSFDFISYQQYGSRSDRTARALEDYRSLVPASRFVPGLAFPEEGDMNNRWLDATEPYLESNVYDIASYANKRGLGGMFMYALDRDGRTYDDHDLNHIVPSTLLWTKTAIAQTRGMTLDKARAAANHFLDRHQASKPVDPAIRKAVAQGETLYDIDKAILGPDYEGAYDPSFDPTLEEYLSTIDLQDLYKALGRADELLADGKTHPADKVAVLVKARSGALETLTARTYTAADISMRTDVLNRVLDSLTAVHKEKGPQTPGGQRDKTKPAVNRKDPGKADKHKAHGGDRLAATGSDVGPVLLALILLAAGAPAVTMARRRPDRVGRRS